MLSLTPTAAEVVEAIVGQEEDLPETAGMRITSEASGPSANGSGPQRDVRFSVVEAPRAEDEVVEGARVYVESGETAELLDDKVLDADLSGEDVRFRLVPQVD
jgi:Fe-S cluster assembly iron-binding protein IscA